MIVKKLEMLTQDLITPSEVLSSDIHGTVLALLTKRFVGRNYMSMHVLGIEIIRMSRIRMHTDTLNASAWVDVQCMMEGLIYSVGDIIPGCTFTKILSGPQLFMESADKKVAISISIEQNPVASAIRADGVFPIVLVVPPSYQPNQSKITAIGQIYYPQESPNTMYKIVGGLSDAEVIVINNLLKKITDARSAVAAIESENPNSYKFGREVLHAYTTGASAAPLAGFTLLDDALSLKEKTSGFIYENIHAYRMDFNWYWSDASAGKYTNMVHCTLFYALNYLCSSKLQYLQNLASFCGYYNTPNTIRTMSTYWQICTKMKIPKPTVELKKISGAASGGAIGDDGDVSIVVEQLESQRDYLDPADSMN